MNLLLKPNNIEKCDVSPSLSKAMCDKAMPAMLRQAQHDTRFNIPVNL
jgi:hypothetical protein